MLSIFSESMLLLLIIQMVILCLIVIIHKSKGGDDMINVIIDFIMWGLSSFIRDVQFPTFDFSAIWEVLVNVLYYPVKILGLFGVKIFFTLLNLDWGLTLSLGVVKTVLRFLRGSH